ncbi:MAG: hypothetical protein AAF915_24585 [Cyanobacteria bacterium P01_D01_bin.50]
MKRKVTIKFVTKKATEAFAINFAKRFNVGYQDYKNMEEEQILEKIYSLINLYDETARILLEVISNFHSTVKILHIEAI